MNYRNIEADPGGVVQDDRGILQQELRRRFNAQVQTVKLQLREGLSHVDPLNSSELSNFLDLFDQRLVVAQYEFLDAIALQRGAAADVIVTAEIPAPLNWQQPLQLSGGLATGLGGAHAAQTVVIYTTTTGHLWWKKLVIVTAAGWIAAHFGIPLATAAGILGIFSGAAGYKVIKKSTSSFARKHLRRAVMKRFDKRIALKLQTWAEERIVT